MRGSRSASEFPQLEGLGLYAAKIDGNGNCLFNALSDQMYGHQGEHMKLRTQVIEFMKNNSDHYKQFIVANVGGGARRNPKRKNAGSFSTPFDSTVPTPDEIERAFQEHIREMAKGGTYGDNLEITAFSSAFKIDVMIYQHDTAFLVHGLDGQSEKDAPKEYDQMVHIAYHTWEHFSSIRNLDGPHTGVPNVPRKLTEEQEASKQEKLHDSPYTQPWQVETVTASLSFPADQLTVKMVLVECKGDIGIAVSKLMEAKSRNSSPGGESVERETDEDDESSGPNKRRDRRPSRATRALRKKKAVKAPNPFLVRLAANSSQESLSSDAASYHLPLADPSSSDSSDSDCKPDWHMESLYQGDYASPAVSDSQRIPSRVKINLKKPQSPGSRKTAQRQTGPQRQRTPSAREKKDIKKQAQKAARRERFQADKNGLTPDTAKTSTSAATKTKKPSPGLDVGFKILYI